MDRSYWLGEAATVRAKRILKDAGQYEFLFPRSEGKTTTIKRDAGVKHTVAFIPKVVRETLPQTEAITRYLFLAPTLYKTCENIWRWVYEHIRYEKDEAGREQVRSPARLFWDRKGDCDCFTTFIDSALENVRRIKGWSFRIINRITKYGGVNFQHIYPVVVTSEGKRIIIDCVTEWFDHEENYSEKEDHELMDLEYLNGIDSEDLEGQLCDEEEQNENYPARAEDDLGRLRKNKSKQGKGDFKKAVHKVNRVNPATLALRNGLMLAMKLNVMNVAGRLKWTYLSENEARKKGLKMDRYAKAKRVREKLEKIFYGAGGDPKNLRESILTGKGNKGKNLSGVPVIPLYAMGKNGMNIREVIGAELFDKENEALSGLGVVTEASLAAATAALTTLSALLKQIGPIKDGESSGDDPESSGESIDPTDDPASSDNKNAKDENDDSGDDSDVPVKFMDDPIGWVKANPGKTAIGAVAIAAVIYGGYRYFKGKDEEQQGERSPQSSQTRQRSSAKQEEVQHVPLAD